MRVLFISNNAPPRLYGGYEIFLGKVLHAAEAKGWETRVLSSAGPRPEDTLAWHNRFFSPLPDKTLRTRERADRKITRDAIDTFRPDRISLWNLGGLARSVFDAATDGTTPYTIHVGDSWPLNFFDKPDPRFDNVLYNSAYTRSVCEQHGLHPRRSRISHLGTELPDTEDRGHNPLPVWDNTNVEEMDTGPLRQGQVAIVSPEAKSAYTRILFAGRICAQKGLLTLLRALPALPGHTLTVAGPEEDPEYMAAVTDAVRTLGVADRVRFPGLVPADEMPHLYAEHDLLVYPSVGAEAFGLSIIEAMAAGLVVITTGVGGIAEIVDDRVNGLLFEPEDHEALAARLAEVAADERLADALSAAGRRTVAERFTLQRALRDVLQFIEGGTPGG